MLDSDEPAVPASLRIEDWMAAATVAAVYGVSAAVFGAALFVGWLMVCELI